MKYKIGTRIDFIDEGDSEEDYHEYYEIIAYAITKDACPQARIQVVYLIWSSYSEYGNQYELMTEDELAEEIEDKEDCGYTVKIKEEE